MNDIEKTRYDRHLRLPQIGEAGQIKLSHAKVLVIGAGGLGCPVLQYLTAAGIGTIGIIDDDNISLSNLQRQVLYQTAQIGQNKAIVAKTNLNKLNDQINILAYDSRLTPLNAIELTSPFDIIVDCTDNFATRYMIDDACLILNKPFVYGAIHTFEGQISVFNYQDGAHYRCLFPNPPEPNSIPTCNEIGVIGTLPGIIGTYQANEVIKIILNLGDILSNKLLTINTLTHTNQVFKFKRKRTADHVPTDIKQFKETNYDWFCNGIEDDNSSKLEVSFNQIKGKIQQEDIYLVDIREIHEQPKYEKTDKLICLPMSEINQRLEEIPKNKEIYVFCQHGIRSLRLVNQLRKHEEFKHTFSIKGGILKMI